MEYIAWSLIIVCTQLLGMWQFLSTTHVLNIFTNSNITKLVYAEHYTVNKPRSPEEVGSEPWWGFFVLFISDISSFCLGFVTMSLLPDLDQLLLIEAPVCVHLILVTHKPDSNICQVRSAVCLVTVSPLRREVLGRKCGVSHHFLIKKKHTAPKD